MGNTAGNGWLVTRQRQFYNFDRLPPPIRAAMRDAPIDWCAVWVGWRLRKGERPEDVLADLVELNRQELNKWRADNAGPRPMSHVRPPDPEREALLAKLQRDAARHREMLKAGRP